MKSKKEKKGFALLMQWAGRNRYFIYISVLLALLSSLLSVVPYYVFYRIMNVASVNALTLDLAKQLALILIGGIFIKAILSASATLCSHKGAYNTLFKVRCMVTEHMAKMPMGALNERSTGEIKCVMNESIEKLELFLAHNLPELVLYLSGPLVIFIWLLTVNVKLGLLSIIPLFLVTIVMILMFTRFFKFMDRVNKSGTTLSDTISEYVGGMRLIKAYNLSVRSFRKYEKAIFEQHDMWCEISKATGPLYAMYVVLLECGILMLVPAGGYMFVHGKIGAGVLLLFAFIGTQYLTDIRPLQELSSNLSCILSEILLQEQLVLFCI